MSTDPRANLVYVPFANSIGVGVIQEENGATIKVVCTEWSEGKTFRVVRDWPREQVFRQPGDCYTFWLKRHDKIRRAFKKAFAPFSPRRVAHLSSPVVPL